MPISDAATNGSCETLVDKSEKETASHEEIRCAFSWGRVCFKFGKCVVDEKRQG